MTESSVDLEQVGVQLLKAKRIASANRIAAHGDAWAALVQAIQGALTDLAEAERRFERHISRGYMPAERFERPGR